MSKICTICDKTESEVKFGKLSLVCYRCRYQKERAIPLKENKELKIEVANLTAENKRLENKYKTSREKYRKYKKLYTELSILNKFKKIKIHNE